MKNYIEIETMPAIKSILDDASKQIHAIIGNGVVLSVKRLIIGTADENKAILKELIQKEFDIPWHRITSNSRKTDLVDARHVYMYFGKYFLNQSTTKTGIDLGYRDHTSVIHGLQKIKDMIDINDPITESINRIKEQLP